MSTDQIASKRTGIFRRIGTLLGTVAVVGIASAAVVQVSGTLADRAAASPGPDPMPSVIVEVTHIDRISGYVLERGFVGQVEPAQQIDLGFESGGTVDAILVDEGEAVRQGDVIARLDTRLLEAEIEALNASRKALIAQADLAQATAERQEALRERGFASQQRFDETRFNLASTKAEIAQIDARLTGLEVQLEKTELRAQFDGEIGARFADAGQTVSGGQPIVTLFQRDRPEFRVGLPADAADEFDVGETATVEFGGVAVSATLRSLRPDVDPATRTRLAIFQLDAETPVYGELGTLRLHTVVPSDGFWIPMASLVEGVEGTWSVYGIAENQTINRHAVEVVHIDEELAFVQGTLADGAQIVGAGPHRVIPGQPVTIRGE